MFPPITSMHPDDLDYWLQKRPRSFIITEVNEIRTAVNALQGYLSLAVTQPGGLDAATSQIMFQHIQKIIHTLDVALSYAQHLDE